MKGFKNARSMSRKAMASTLRCARRVARVRRVFKGAYLWRYDGVTFEASVGPRNPAFSRSSIVVTY